MGCGLGLPSFVAGFCFVRFCNNQALILCLRTVPDLQNTDVEVVWWSLFVEKSVHNLIHRFLAVRAFEICQYGQRPVSYDGIHKGM
jgi:hypothetical protein